MLMNGPFDMRLPSCRLWPLSSLSLRKRARGRLTPLCATVLRFRGHQLGVSGDTHTVGFKRETSRDGHDESLSKLNDKMADSVLQDDGVWLCLSHSDRATSTNICPSKLTHHANCNTLRKLALANDQQRTSELREKPHDLRQLPQRVAVEMGHRRFGVTRVRSAGLDCKVEMADPLSNDAATDIPCCLMPCHVVIVVAIVAAFDCFCVQARASMRERVRMQLGGTSCCYCCCGCCVLLLL